MKKTTRNILITLLIVVVLGGACAALLLTDPKRAEGEAESSSAAPDTSLIARDIADVESVEVKNPNGAFTVLVKEQKSEASAASAESEASASETTYTYSMVGFEKYPLKDSTFDTAIKGACALSAAKDLGTVEDLAGFGLTGDEASVVTMNFKDGSKETFTAGVEAGETAGRYVLYNDKVYIASINTAFLNSQYENFAPFSYTIEDISDDSGMQPYSIMEKLNLSGSNFPEPIKILYDEEKIEFRMSTPVNTDCSTTAMDTVTQALKSLSSASVVVANATAKDLAKYGLDKPFALADFTINGQSHTLAVSEQKVDGARYMIADGDPSIIYTIAAETVSPWAEIEAFNLHNSYVFLPMIMNVDDFTIEAGGKSCTVDLSRTKNEEKSSDGQTVYDYTAKRDGKEVVYEDVTSFYRTLISIAALNDNKLEYESAAEVKITFNYYEGGQDILEYRKAGDDRLVALLNGQYSATVRRTSIDEFLKGLEEFKAK